jgi:hypothetical protein
MLDELELVDDEELGSALDEEDELGMLEELDDEELEELHGPTKSLGMTSKVDEVLGIDQITNFTPSPAAGVTVNLRSVVPL